MRPSPDSRQRRSVRLQGYDYAAAGAYFVAICTYGRGHLLGAVVNGQMTLNAFGEIVHQEWLQTAAIRREICLDAFQVMPDHVHGIVMINPAADPVSIGAPTEPPNDVRAKEARVPSVVWATGRSPSDPRGPAKRSLGAMVAGFKAAVTKRINEERRTPGALIWQRNYYEHVIRTEHDLAAIRQYIVDNPSQWEVDPDDEMVTALNRTVGWSFALPNHQT